MDPKDIDRMKLLAAQARLAALKQAQAEDSALQARLNALLSYKVYLVMLRACGVKQIPVHGWVA